MFSARFVITALATVFAVVSAVPITELETRYDPELTVCTDINFGGTCVTIPSVSDECIELTGGLTILDKRISSAIIPDEFVCTFFVQFGCLTQGTSDTDEVALESNRYPDFTQIQGIFGSPSFENLTSSINCSPL